MKHNILYILLVLLVAGCVKDDPVEDTESKVQVGGVLPRFEAVMNTGDTIRTENLREGVSVIVLFNTGCADCREELPQLQIAYEECKSKNINVKFVCIAREELSFSIESFWDLNSLTLPYSPQPGRIIYNMFAEIGIPRIYISDSNLIVTKIYGPDDKPTPEALISAIHAAQQG